MTYARGPPTAPGRALDTSVRTRIEPHVGLDLSHVVVRHDPEASAAAEALHARAFTSGSTIFLGARALPTDVALMAHEATHVAQQQSTPAARTLLMRQAEDSFLPDISLPDVSVGDFIPDWVLEGVREAVRSIPGYTLLTQITGVDPLTDEAVEVSREELIEALLTYRPLVAAVLFTGLRISELLGLVWDDVDLGTGVIHVRAQLSRAHRSSPPTRVAPKTRAAVRDIPLVPQLRDMLRAHHAGAGQRCSDGWVFPSQAGTPLGHRNAQRRALTKAARRAGLEDGRWPPLRFHDLRHTFASHLIIDLRLDVAQVSRILGHAQITTTLSVYTHLFDDARHADELRGRMAASAFARLLDTPPDRSEGGRVRALPAPRTPAALSARKRAALRWGT